MTNKYKHPPGHKQSVIDGCTCPVKSNFNGDGCGYVDSGGNKLFIFDDRCKLHGNGDRKLPPDEICYTEKEYRHVNAT